MTHSKQLHGNHSWDLVLRYYACPSCKYIIENKDKFVKSFEGLSKDLECPRCHREFRIEKKMKPTFGPLLGNDPEIIE